MQVGDVKAAVSDLTHGADLGDAYAQDLLGKMYLLGTSIPPDRAKAIEWLKKAADQGYAPSQAILPLALNKDFTPLPMPGAPKL